MNKPIDNTAVEALEEEIPETFPEKVEIVGVRFKKSGKIYYFDPNGHTVAEGQNVIVETARGIEYGNAVVQNKLVDYREIVPPLKKVIRIATQKDDEHYAENSAKESEAFNICLEKIAAHKLEMKLVDVEYTFDNNKLLFYFTADGRIDFRELVKDLASVFRTRIELRQIGVRDEAKLIGGLGVCGRPFCCKEFLPDFAQVSIKMAKEQNLSLSSTKISGSCGRLMCCLRFEQEVYETEYATFPKVDSIVETPAGKGVIIESSFLTGKIKVKLNGDQNAPAKVYTKDDIKVVGMIKRNDEGEELKKLED